MPRFPGWEKPKYKGPELTPEEMEQITKSIVGNTGSTHNPKNLPAPQKKLTRDQKPRSNWD